MGLFRPTSAEIHLASLRHNFESLKGLLPPSVRIMGMVKADAYGHGAVQISKALAEMGVASLGVATVEEGLELRESAIDVPILVLGGLMGVGTAAAGMMVGANLTPVVHSAEVLDFLEATAHAAGKRIGIHLKVDTGMTRLGVLPAALPHFLNRLKQCGSLRLDGVMTHFADADDQKYTSEQLRLFKECISHIQELAGPVPVWHVANSTAILNGDIIAGVPASEHWVRPGLALYGADGVSSKGRMPQRPVMALRSRVVMIKTVAKGTKISYGCSFETERPSRIGIVPIGYADGYPWALSNKAEVLVRGKRAPVVGRVTMDMTMIDLTGIEGSHVNDEVVLMGQQGNDCISCQELAEKAGTIPYEILCGISKRMPRVYIYS